MPHRCRSCGPRSALEKCPSGAQGRTREDSHLPPPVGKDAAVAGVGEAGLHDCDKSFQTGELF